MVLKSGGELFPPFLQNAHKGYEFDPEDYPEILEADDGGNAAISNTQLNSSQKNTQ